ncbi:hypothetical protein [Paraburkholderia sp.]|uniref:hypothetical protein n=1 Tax=Paraburkholderia sp. TaxID=1926495 RepID=UPI003D6E9979
MLTSEDLYESTHWRELDMRDKIDTRLQASFTLATALIGAISFLVSNVDTGHAFHTLDYVFFALLLVTFALLALSGAFFFRSSAGLFFQKDAYKTLPASLELVEYEKQWDDLIVKYPQETAGKTSDGEVKKLLVKYYLNSQKTNAGINDQRAKNIARINKLIFVEAILTVVVFGLFYFGGLNKTNFEKPQDIRITAPVDIRSMPPVVQDRYVFWCPPTGYVHAPTPTHKKH